METNCDVTFKRFCSSAFVTVLTVVWLAALCPAAFAEKKNDVAAELTAEKITFHADGKEVLGPADKAEPGDVVLYTAAYRNQTKATVTGVQASLPIPAGMEYLADTAKPDGGKASTDGVHYFPMPLKRLVKTADGKEREELVPLSEYRNLRWNVGSIEAGQNATVSARVRVLPTGQTKSSR